MFVFFFFFFSSRRRHTRLQGDWSSDVCSSDLDRWWRPGGHDTEVNVERGPNGRRQQAEQIRAASATVIRHNILRSRRSEEHTSELQSPCNLVCRLLLEKKNSNNAYLLQVFHFI